MFEVLPPRGAGEISTIHIKKTKHRNSLAFIWSDNINILRHGSISLRIHMSVPTFFEQLKEHLDRHYYESLKQILKETDADRLKSGDEIAAARILLLRDSLQHNICEYEKTGNYDLLVQRLIEARTRGIFLASDNMTPSL